MSAYYVIVCDERAKRSAVVGPLVDDTEITDMVAAAQDQGRTVRCYSIDASRTTRARLEAEQRSLGREICGLASLGM